jgi:hypothetical protein
MNKRKSSYWSEDIIPLTSKRVNLILSNPLNSKNYLNVLDQAVQVNKPFFITPKNV